MNIAFIHDIFPAGGAERVTIDIATYLSSLDRGYNIFVYCQGITHELMTPNISEVMTIRTLRVKTNAEKSHKIEKLIVSDKIDIVVQVVHRLADIEGIRRRTGVKVVMANHGEPFWQRYRIIHKKKLHSPIAWALYKRFWYVNMGHAMKKAISITQKNYNSCDAYVVLCDEYKNAICQRLGLIPEQSHIIPIGNSERPVDDVCYDKENIIMYCGRLYNATKAIDALLRIWKRVQGELTDWKLVLVGDGPDRESLQKQVASDKLERVVFAGWTADVASYYRKASIVCLTSRTESWGLALTEAQTNGVIPIAYCCSEGVKAILSPSGINGFTVTPGDEEEYARVLLTVVNMSEVEKMKIRRNVVKKALEYSPETVGKQWDQLFTGLCSTE